MAVISSEKECKLSFFYFQSAIVFLVSKDETLRSLSPPQRLLLVNTSERKKREAGALQRENGSAGNTQGDCRRPLWRRELRSWNFKSFV